MKNKITKGKYNGLIPLVSGEIAEDFTEFFAKSEQKPTALALGVLVDKNGVKRAGGYIINPMPDATDEEISKIIEEDGKLEAECHFCHRKYEFDKEELEVLKKKSK